MARIGFGISAVASLVFTGWFFITEMRSPGVSFAIALIGMPLLLAVFGSSKIKGGGITKDGKGAGWAIFGLASLGVGDIALFFKDWLSIAAVWFALQVPMLVGIITSDTPER